MASAQNRGKPARPETLRFADYLASNSSATASTFQEQAFDYAQESSNALDAFANQVQAMVKKTQNFLNMMEEYSSPTGIQRLEDKVSNFTMGAVEDVLDVLSREIDRQMLTISNQAYSAAASLTGGDVAVVLQLEATQRHAAAAQVELDMSGIWNQVLTLLSSLQSNLPTVTDDLKFARREVSAVASTLKTTFDTFAVKGPPIFQLVSKLYKVLWVCYFVLFGLLTIGVLFYGLWASGWFGGPKASAAADESYEAPRGFRERCRVCCACCDSCLRGCHDSHFCFWSIVVILEIIVLVLFVVSIVLCLLAGIKAFISAGCAQVYMLGDNSICTGVLGTIRRWLVSFMTNDLFHLEEMCEGRTLLACNVIGAKLKTSALTTTIGSLIAAVLSFQMIIESAVLHERARWRRIFDEESKKV